MDNDKKLFEELLKADGIDPTAATEHEREVFAKMLDQQSKPKRSTPAIRHDIRRIIMKNRITKFAVAAVFIAAVLLSISLFDKTATPAWAIEQSIEAMKNYRGIHYSGTIAVSWNDFFKGLGVEDLPQLPESMGEFEMWAQADQELSRSSNTKIICQDNIIITGSKLQTYVQIADGTIYHIQGDLMKIDPWPTSKLLRHLRETTDTWTELYGMNAETGKERILVRCSDSDRNRSWEFEFDAESKLLISLKQWNSSDSHEGLPNINIWKIVHYEELPDDIFDVDISDPGEIIAVKISLYDPEYGISAEGLTKEQACYKIMEDFWQAVNDQDFDMIRKLIPLTAGWNDETIINGFGGDLEPVELLEMGQIYESKIGPVVPCTIKTKDKDVIVDLIIMFREIDGNSSCVIHSNKGKSRPVE
jgi:hypothetical protein